MAIMFLPGRSVLGRRERSAHSSYLVEVARKLRGQHAVEIDLGILVVVDQQQQLAELAIGQREVAAEPDVGRLPLGAAPPRRACPACRSRPGLAFQAVSSNSGLNQPSAGFSSVYRHVAGSRRRGGTRRLVHRRRRELAARQCGERLRRIDLEHAAVVGQQPVALGFDVGDLRVDGRREALLVAQLPHASATVRDTCASACGVSGMPR